MPDDDFTVVSDLAHALHQAIRDVVLKSDVTDKALRRRSLAAAMALAVSYDGMQEFLEELAMCADAKEQARSASVEATATVN